MVPHFWLQDLASPLSISLSNGAGSISIDSCKPLVSCIDKGNIGASQVILNPLTAGSMTLGCGFKTIKNAALPCIDPKLNHSQIDQLKCTKCSYQAFHRQQLRDHMIDSHKDEILYCLCCSHLFFDDADRQEHYKEAHPKCYCKECGFVTKHSYILTRHMQSHSEEGRKCPECGKLLKDQYVLKMHMKMIHSLVEESFNCSICPKVFNRKAHLKRHMKTHYKEKPFSCPYSDCSYRGFERSDISKHLLIHTEPKHECLTCHRLFRHAKNRDLHTKRHTGQKDYKCGVCGFYGYTFTDVRKHIERRHSKLNLPSETKHFSTEIELESEERDSQVYADEDSKDMAFGTLGRQETVGEPPELHSTSLKCKKTDQSPANHVECPYNQSFPGDSLPLYEIQTGASVLEFLNEDC